MTLSFTHTINGNLYMAKRRYRGLGKINYYRSKYRGYSQRYGPIPEGAKIFYWAEVSHTKQNISAGPVPVEPRGAKTVSFEIEGDPILRTVYKNSPVPWALWNEGDTALTVVEVISTRPEHGFDPFERIELGVPWQPSEKAKRLASLT
jgi:hypothetical protein